MANFNSLTVQGAQNIDSSARNESRHDQRGAMLRALTMSGAELADMRAKDRKQFFELKLLASDYAAFCRRHLELAEQACARLGAARPTRTTDMDGVEIKANITSGLHAERSGEQLQIALVDSAGRVVTAGPGVARELFVAACKSYEDFWISEGIIRPLSPSTPA